MARQLRARMVERSIKGRTGDEGYDPKWRELVGQSTQEADCGENDDLAGREHGFVRCGPHQLNEDDDHEEGGNHVGRTARDPVKHLPQTDRQNEARRAEHCTRQKSLWPRQAGPHSTSPINADCQEDGHAANEYDRIDDP